MTVDHELMEGTIRELMKTRTEHIEQMACAFLLQVGPHKATEYELVEQRSDDMLTTRWYFRPRPAPPRAPKDPA